MNGNGAFISSFGRSSEDGTLVFFTTREPLIADDVDTALDIYRRDLNTSITIKISSGNGAFDAKLGGDPKCGGLPSPFPPCTDPAPGSAARALQFDVSADGQHVFFETHENLFGPGGMDSNGSSDVYERVGTTPSGWSPCRRLALRAAFRTSPAPRPTARGRTSGLPTALTTDDSDPVASTATSASAG